jgi:hypothetical protein
MTTIARPQAHWREPVRIVLLVLGVVAGVAGIMIGVPLAEFLHATAVGKRQAEARTASFCGSVVIGADLSSVQRLAAARGVTLIRKAGTPIYRYRERAPGYDETSCEVVVDARNVVVARTFHPVDPDSPRSN